MIRTLSEAVEQYRELPIDVQSPLFDEPVAFVEAHLRQLGAQHFLDMAAEAHPRTKDGMQYKLVGSQEAVGDNADSAILMPAPFGNGIWPHLIARAEAIAALYGRESGTPVPVLLTAAPGAHSSFGLNQAEVGSVRRGNMQPIARRHVQLLDDLGRGHLEGTIAYSAPALFAAAIALRAQTELDVAGNVMLGEPPHATQRGELTQLIQLMRDGKYKAAAKAEDIRVINEIFDSGQAGPEFMGGIWKQRAENRALGHANSLGGLTPDLYELGAAGIPTVLVHAHDSLITPRVFAEAAFDYAQHRLQAAGHDSSLRRVEVGRVSHTLGDRVGRLAALATASLRVE